MQNVGQLTKFNYTDKNARSLNDNRETKQWGKCNK